uniref:11-beta-hydroxysteroid dehydrogenase type 2 n=1 Tax=Callorhinchus milii TaxID=7868 RepID=A0A4W3H0U4_CALMI
MHSLFFYSLTFAGCDSGFGKTIAQHFDSMGFKVFATVLNKDGPGAIELVQMCSEELTLIQMDLTKPQDIENAVQFTKEKLGEKGLWGLVNNAGICINIGDAELSLMSNYRGCMEVNFFGAITITKAFLPLIRREKGRIVNVSSPAGETPFPSFAAYGASKAALTLFTNILRQELNFWGVKVCTILPGFYKTAKVQDHTHWEQQNCNLLKNLSSELLQDYGEEYILEIKNQFLKRIHFAKEDFSPVIDSITDAVLSTNPRPRYYAGKDVIIQYIILNFLPITISDLLFNRFFIQHKILPKALHK